MPGLVIDRILPSISSRSTSAPSTMSPTLLHLPNGQTITVSPVFAGLSFKANDLNIHHSFFPPGWTIVLESTDDDDSGFIPESNDQSHLAKNHQVHRFRRPTLHNDHVFISSISNPSSIDFKPATSPTRQIAMMLWVTLCWYFQQVSTSLRIQRKSLIFPKACPGPPSLHFVKFTNPARRQAKRRVAD